jgi:hypothetical protein
MAEFPSFYTPLKKPEIRCLSVLSNGRYTYIIVAPEGNYCVGVYILYPRIWPGARKIDDFRSTKKQYILPPEIGVIQGYQ